MEELSELIDALSQVMLVALIVGLGVLAARWLVW